VKRRNQHQDPELEIDCPSKMAKLAHLLVILPILIAISLVIFPHFWVAIFVLIDFYTPWVLFESPLYDSYHNFLVSRLTEKSEIPLPELTAEEATYDRLFKESDGFTFPIVIRGFLGNTTAVKHWSDHDWWINNYGDEEVLCGTLANVSLSIYT
jgi:hypothetical protein